MPPCGRRDHFVAVWTASPLTFPESKQCFSTPEGVRHLAPEALFEVEVPWRVVGVHTAVNLDMTCNGETMGGEEANGAGRPLRAAYLPHKHPVMSVDGLKVAGLHPSCAFGGMAALGPAPQGLKDGVVHGLEDVRADHMPVIQRPAPDEWVQVTDERPGGSTLVGFNDITDIPQHRFDALHRWLNEQLPVVFAEVLSEEIKAVCD